MTKLWLGIDVGTTAVKAAAYEPDGRQVALAEAPSTVNSDTRGGHEQDMGEVRDTVFRVLHDLARQCPNADFAALGVAAQGDGLWCIDAKGAPAGPAMLWNDTRSAEDLAHLTQTGNLGVVGRGCHTSLWTGTSAMLWRWCRTHRPDVVAKTAHAVTCADWVGLCLTGHVASDYSNTSIPFLDFQTKTYGSAQIEALGCTDIAQHLASPRRADSLLSQLSADAAHATGLPERLPVSVGTLDLSAMIVGMGMDQPGQTMMILGTTAVVNILTDKVEPSDTPVGASVLHPTSDAIIRVLAPTTGAAAFDWFAGLHPQSLGGASAGEIATRMNALVTDVPPGSNGVTFLPYLNGERAPFVAPDIRAAFHGLSATTTKGEMGRAVMEGAAFSLRHCFEEEGGLPNAPVRLTGGGARNAVWCQIIADVVGQPVVVSDAPDHGLWGAAAIGAAAAGLGDAVSLAARRAEQAETFTPRNHAAYSAPYRRYATLSRHHRAMQTDLSSASKDQP
ncbi:MAG: FGGY family carbohydrate kinase [Pseudomonadota bacterium]